MRLDASLDQVVRDLLDAAEFVEVQVGQIDFKCERFFESSDQVDKDE